MRGKIYFGSLFQRLESMMVGSYGRTGGSHHGFQEAEIENTCARCFSFFTFLFHLGPKPMGWCHPSGLIFSL
jgi:hypothetical protein